MNFEIVPPRKLTGLSPTEILAVSDDDLEYAVIHYVVADLLREVDGPEAIGAWPESLQAWYLTFMVDVEVLNGGFNQLFFNPSGALAHAAPWAFERLGHYEVAGLVSEALRLLEEHAPALEAAANAGTVDAFMETYIDQPFSDLDRRYAECENELRVARIRFLREHAAKLAV